MNSKNYKIEVKREGHRGASLLPILKKYSIIYKEEKNI